MGSPSLYQFLQLLSGFLRFLCQSLKVAMFLPCYLLLQKNGNFLEVHFMSQISKLCSERKENISADFASSNLHINERNHLVLKCVLASLFTWPKNVWSNWAFVKKTWSAICPNNCLDVVSNQFASVWRNMRCKKLEIFQKFILCQRCPVSVKKEKNTSRLNFFLQSYILMKEITQSSNIYLVAFLLDRKVFQVIELSWREHEVLITPIIVLTCMRSICLIFT